MIKKMIVAAAAAGAVSVPLAGLAWAEPPDDPGSNGIGAGGMPDKLGNFVEHGIEPANTGLKAPLPLGAVVRGLAKTPTVNTPDAVAAFEADLWKTHDLANGQDITSDGWGNITPGLAIKPLTPGCEKGRSAVPDGAPKCVG
ncbi:MAG TPA: hypothetical protein VJR50_14650 [Mycobacterium sp.]|nr:hypothetical protein [Mycobacterium sp.]